MSLVQRYSELCGLAGHGESGKEQLEAKSGSGISVQKLLLTGSGWKRGTGWRRPAAHLGLRPASAEAA